MLVISTGMPACGRVRSQKWVSTGERSECSTGLRVGRDTCASGAEGGWVIVLAAFTAPAVDNVGFGDGYETLLAWDERSVPPGAEAFFAGWAVGLAAVLAGISARCPVVATWAVKLMCGPSGGFWCVGVEPGYMP